MNLKARFPNITRMCYSVIDNNLYVFVQKIEDTQNLSKFLEATYFFPCSILEDWKEDPKGVYKVSQLELNNYAGFCNYLYQLETPEDQINLLRAEFSELAQKSNKIAINKLLGTLDIIKLKDPALAKSSLLDLSSFYFGPFASLSMLGYNP